MALLTGGMGLALGVEWCIVMDLAPPTVLWPLLGLSFSLGNLAYSQLTATFPIHLSGRVNTALNPNFPLACSSRVMGGEFDRQIELRGLIQSPFIHCLCCMAIAKFRIGFLPSVVV